MLYEANPPEKAVSLNQCCSMECTRRALQAPDRRETSLDGEEDASADPVTQQPQPPTFQQSQQHQVVVAAVVLPTYYPPQPIASSQHNNTPSDDEDSPPAYSEAVSSGRHSHA